jgi:hypothetical protein
LRIFLGLVNVTSGFIGLPGKMLPWSPVSLGTHYALFFIFNEENMAKN